MNPSEGSSTLNAMHDAVALANWLDTVQSPSKTNVSGALKEYRDERYPIAKDAFDSSQALAEKLTKVTMDQLCRLARRCC
jgi:2-polyprenyl-6-methoxyphenol hydroxylase-like FAD-dependent oxidoreductase